MTDDIWATLAQCDDWEALYINDILVEQGHSLSSQDILELIVHRRLLGYTVVYFGEEDMEELRCRFPENLNELQDTEVWKRNINK